MRSSLCLPAVFLSISTFVWADEPALPAGLTVEAPAPAAGATNILFIAGSNFFKPGEHEYIGGCAALMDLVRQSGNVQPILALDWPTKPTSTQHLNAVVLFVDGAAKHPAANPERAKQFDQWAQAGVGLVLLHQGVDVDVKLGDAMRQWAGAAWEKGRSQRAHWVHEFKNFPEHPIAQGVTPFKIDDGYLFQLHFVEPMKGITPILKTTNPKTPGAKLDEGSIVAWTYDRPSGGRSFCFTGGHLHISLAEEGYRRLLTNGILWSAGQTIPAGGAPVAMKSDQLQGYLTQRTAVK